MNDLFRIRMCQHCGQPIRLTSARAWTHIFKSGKVCKGNLGTMAFPLPEGVLRIFDEE